AVIGTGSVQCRSSPRRTNVSCGRSRISRYTSPAGPPPGPTSPWPVSLMRVPVSTPAGMSTVRVRRLRTRPSPEHSGHGSGITVPNPWHAPHGLDVMTWPRNDRATRWTTPRPPHTSHVRGEVPGRQQLPWHVGQTTAVSTWTSRRAPKTASARLISSRTGASCPRRARGAGPRRLPGAAPAQGRTAAAALARRADGGCADLDLAARAEDGAGEADLEPHERVLPAPGARDGTSLGPGSGAEEGLEDVLEPEPRAAEAARAAAGRRRVDAAVVHGALLRVREHLVRARHVLEALLGAVA